jgi:hypothetical protein
MESLDLEILHWQGRLDSYIVNIFWMYLHLGQALKTGFQQNTEIEDCHDQL